MTKTVDHDKQKISGEELQQIKLKELAIIEKMSAPQILSAIRGKDLSTIKSLVKHLVHNEIMTTREIYDVLDDQGINLDRSTVNKWLVK